MTIERLLRLYGDLELDKVPDSINPLNVGMHDKLEIEYAGETVVFELQERERGNIFRYRASIAERDGLENLKLDIVFGPEGELYGIEKEAHAWVANLP